MSAGAPVLAAQVQKMLELRVTQRVLFSAAEGAGRTSHLQQLSSQPVPSLRIDCNKGRVASQVLRALLGVSSTNHDHLWEATCQASQLSAFDLEPERKQLAAELLASLLGIRRPLFVSHGLDEDARREGAFLELGRWVAERCEAGGLVLAFDDAHRCDDDGMAFIELLSQQEGPLCLVVSYDEDPERFSAAFKVRRTAWLAEARWQCVSAVMPEEEALVSTLTHLGLTPEKAALLCQHAQRNPGLAMGVWRFWQSRPELELHELPKTLDALRAARVRLLGPQVTRAATTLAILGGLAPLAALSAIDPGLPVALQCAGTAGLVTFERQGSLDVCRFTDERLGPGLALGATSPHSLGVLVTAGVWAAQALEQVEPQAFATVAHVLVPLAGPALDGPVFSLWLEAWACVAPGRADAVSRLEAALASASGVRRLVLLRRLAELKLYLGHSEEALRLLLNVPRTVNSASQQPHSRAIDILALQPFGALDRWDTLTTDEALLAIELQKGETYSHLLRREETEKLFTEVEKKLGRLTGGASVHLWLRWARAWSWFLCEVLGRAADAVRACAMVRQKLPATTLLADEDSLGFVRAQEIASVSVGDFTRAKQLADELIALAEKRGRLRDVCLAWNARAILHFGQGELVPAKRAFEKAIALAKATAWARREAISSHNLSLVLTELGEFDAATALEATYASLSAMIGNYAAKAEAPLMFANIELSRGNLTAADAHLLVARKICDSNGWAMMSANGRAVAGRLRLMRYRNTNDALELTKAKNDFLAAIEVLEEHSTAWTEELDPGEVYALYAATLKLAGQQDQARAVLGRARARMPAQNVVSHEQVNVALAYVDGSGVEPSLKWFEDRAFERRVMLWRLLSD